jgi:hypothetical protein
MQHLCLPPLCAAGHSGKIDGARKQPRRSSRCWRKIGFVGIAIVQVTERRYDELAVTGPRYGTNYVPWMPGNTVSAFHQGEIARLCGTAQGVEIASISVRDCHDIASLMRRAAHAG